MSVRVVTIEDVRAAEPVVRPHVSPAPLIRSYELERHLGLPEGRRVVRNHATGAYESEIAGARAGDVHTPHQWISFPDDVPVSFVVDASEAIARARARGVTRLDIQAVVSVVHYDANGVPSDAGAPLTLTLDMEHPTSAAVPVPVAGQTDRTPPVTNATPAPGPNLQGWNNTDVTVALAAVENQGGSGIKALTYAAYSGPRWAPNPLPHPSFTTPTTVYQGLSVGPT